jgi:uncharacterized RDD family membrane protein YckC
VSNDNFDIDNLLDDEKIFKPLTEGLGFHHSIKEQKELKADLATKKVVLKEQLETRAKELNLRSTKTNNISMGELAPFYSDKTEEAVEVELHSYESELEEASLVTRFGAWFVDAVIIASIITISLVSIIFIANIPLSYIRDNILNLDLILSFMSISILFYSFYFSFFDKTSFSTPGKRLLGLRVLSIKGGPITFIQAFSRVLITLASILTLGLGSILRIQDKLTDTIVVNK